MANRVDRLEILSPSEAETLRLGAVLASAAFPGLTLLLRGPLGSGKTTLIRGIAGALGARHVRSPSFTLINEYDGYIPIVHVDLYRLSDGGGDELGLEEYLLRDVLLLVEWPERWTSPPSEDLWSLSFDFHGDGEKGGGQRRITIEATGARAVEALSFVKSVLNSEGPEGS